MGWNRVEKQSNSSASAMLDDVLVFEASHAPVPFSRGSKVYVCVCVRMCVCVCVCARLCVEIGKEVK